MMMMMMIGIKTGTMASVIQGTVRPRGTCGRLVPRTYGCDDDATTRAKGTKQYAKTCL